MQGTVESSKGDVLWFKAPSFALLFMRFRYLCARKLAVFPLVLSALFAPAPGATVSITGAIHGRQTITPVTPAGILTLKLEPTVERICIDLESQPIPAGNPTETFCVKNREQRMQLLCFAETLQLAINLSVQ